MGYDRAGLTELLHFGPEMPHAGTEFTPAFPTRGRKATYIGSPFIKCRAGDAIPRTPLPFPETDFTQT